jgi:hypothetical protein
MAPAMTRQIPRRWQLVKYDQKNTTRMDKIHLSSSKASHDDTAPVVYPAAYRLTEQWHHQLNYPSSNIV